jgi:ribosomal protein L19E
MSDYYKELKEQIDKANTKDEIRSLIAKELVKIQDLALGKFVENEEFLKANEVKKQKKVTEEIIKSNETI